MKKLTFLTVLLLAINTLQAQKMDKRYTTAKKTLPFAVVEEIDSKELGEQRGLNVYLPQGYDPDSTATYPTIYVLDGSAHEDFPHIAGLAQFMNMYNLLPKSIVVGIANKGRSRYRDFTHVSTSKKDKKNLPQGGGSEKFMNYVEKEVLPLVKKNYKTNGQRTIIGQSLGGLMATEFLIKRSHLFDDYIIVSPSLWWGKRVLVKSAAKFFKTHPNLKKRIFVSLGKEHPIMHKVADKLVKAIRDSNNPNITLFYEPVLTEDHATILHKAVYKAFERLYPKKKKKH